MQIHFYEKWDEPTNKKGQSAASSLVARIQSINLNFVYIIMSVIAICVFSYLIFANHSGQARLHDLGGSPTKSGEIFYTVQSGDTLWSIAGKHYPELSPEEAIERIQYRNSFQGATIHAGQTLLLP